MKSTMTERKMLVPCWIITLKKKKPWSLNKNNLFCFHGGLYKLINIISGITSSIKKISRIGNRNIWKYKIILRVTCILIKYIDFIDLIKIRSWLPSDIPLIVAVHRICWSGSKIWFNQIGIVCSYSYSVAHDLTWKELYGTNINVKKKKKHFLQLRMIRV